MSTAQIETKKNNILTEIEQEDQEREMASAKALLKTELRGLLKDIEDRKKWIANSEKQIREITGTLTLVVDAYEQGKIKTEQDVIDFLPDVRAKVYRNEAAVGRNIHEEIAKQMRFTSWDEIRNSCFC